MAKHTTRHVDMDQVKANPVYQDDLKKLAESLIPKDFVKIDLTFPPYWRCGTLKGFYGKVLYRDERNPNFVRYHIKNLGPAVACQKGPVADGNTEMVETGRTFTIGAFATLPLDRLAGFAIAVICTGERDLPPNEQSEGQPRTIYDFDVHIAEKDQKLLDSQREEDMVLIQKLQREANREALGEITKLAIKHRIETNGARAVSLGV